MSIENTITGGDLGPDPAPRSRAQRVSVAVLVFAADSPSVKHGMHFTASAYASEGEGGEGGDGQPVHNPDFEYLQMKPLILPIITDRGLTQQVSLVVSLELPFGEKKEIEEQEPRLADAYLQDLYGALGSGQAMMKGRMIDVYAVK